MGNSETKEQSKAIKAGPRCRSIDNAMSSVRLVRQGAEVKSIVGYGAVFYDGTADTEYRVWDDFVERIAPGAFDRALAEADDVRGLFNHDPNQVLGRTSSGTMRLKVDKKGLVYEIEADDTQVARDVQRFIERGDVTGSSFSFEITDQEWRTEDGVDIREIQGVKLYDTGPVTFPAYPGTEAELRTERAEVQRSHEEWLAARAETERVEREAAEKDRAGVLAIVEELKKGNTRGQ